MQKFDLNEQWELYCQRVFGSRNPPLPEDQLRETKRAFMGASGQMLLLLRDDLTQLSESRAMDTLSFMIDQVGEFWKEEVKKQS